MKIVQRKERKHTKTKHTAFYSTHDYFTQHTQKVLQKIELLAQRKRIETPNAMKPNTRKKKKRNGTEESEREQPKGKQFIEQILSVLLCSNVKHNTTPKKHSAVVRLRQHNTRR